MRLSWWLILLLLWLAPAALASLGMLWCGWVAPALFRPRNAKAPEATPDLARRICLPDGPADCEAVGVDELHPAIPSASPPLMACRRDAPADPCIDLARV